MVIIFLLYLKKMNDRLKTLISNNRTTSSKNINNTATKDKTFFVIPYIKNISESIASTTNSNEFTIGYRVLNKLSRFIKTHKNSNQLSSKRQLKTRLNKHINNIKSSSTLSVISEHKLNFESRFQLEQYENSWFRTSVL